MSVVRQMSSMGYVVHLWAAIFNGHVVYALKIRIATGVAPCGKIHDRAVARRAPSVNKAIQDLDLLQPSGSLCNA